MIWSTNQLRSREALLKSLLLGCVGLFFTSFLQLFTIYTPNFQTSSELSFSFTLTFEVFCASLLYSLIMGSVGSVLPAFREAREILLRCFGWSEGE